MDLVYSKGRYKQQVCVHSSQKRFYASALLFDLPPLQPSKIKIVVVLKDIYMSYIMIRLS